MHIMTPTCGLGKHSVFTELALHCSYSTMHSTALPVHPLPSSVSAHHCCQTFPTPWSCLGKLTLQGGKTDDDHHHTRLGKIQFS